MGAVLTTEGSLALAISALAVVLGWRFALPARGRDLGGVAVYALALGVTYAAAYGLLPQGGAVEAGPAARLVGGALMILGLALAGAAYKARLQAGRGRLAVVGPYARIRQPLHVGLALVLMGHLLRLPSSVGLLATAVALASQVLTAAVEEREAAAAFGAEWEAYARRTGAVLPRSGRAR